VCPKAGETVEEVLVIKYGYCHCGCGQKTTIAKQNHKPYGWVKGEPLRFVSGHNRRADLVGKVFGRLTVLNKNEQKSNGKRSYYDCLCECGKKTTVQVGSLKIGSVKSCGCLLDAYYNRIERIRPVGMSQKEFKLKRARDRAREHREKLTVQGIKYLLTHSLKAKDITPEIIEMKRAQLKIYRQLKKAKEELNG
jgi:hypothetical protein